MSLEKTKTDHRKHARFEMLDYALMESGKKGPTKGLRAVVVDVSLGGFQIRSRSHFDGNDVYCLTIGHNGDSISVTAEVRYSVKVEDSDLYATGFKVRPADNAERVAWVDYVHSVFQAQKDSLA